MADCDVSFISDEIQVKQILLNFISNSVKFTNQGRIDIRVKTKKKNNKDILLVIIKDTGCGVKKEDTLKLFSEYSKFNNTKNNAFGTGLGLNICKSMADNLNMKIKFKSEENKGTKITLSIFNPIMAIKENLLESNKTWRMSVPNQSNESFLKISSEELVKTSPTLIVKEENINFEDDTIRKALIKKTTLISSSCSSRIQINEKRQSFNSNCNILERTHSNYTINRVISEFNYSIISSIISRSPETFDLDADNQKSTRRLSRDHDYGLNQSMLSKYIPEYYLSRQSSSEFKSRKNLLLSHNLLVNKLQIPGIIRQTTSTNTGIFDDNEVKSENLEISLNSLCKPSIKSKNFVLPTEKILIVDDQFHTRRAMVNLVSKFIKEKKLNFDIIEECDGIDCLKTIIQFPSHIRYIFIDENMNYMNGSETAGIIRRLYNVGKIAKIKMILTSGEDNLSLRQNLFDYCISKPVKRESIAEILF